MCENFGKIYGVKFIFSFGKMMTKIIMVKERKIFKTPLLKGIKL
jgi:hypothetical protein